MIAMCSLSAIVILALWLPGTLLAPGNAAIYIVFSMLYGFASGAFVGMVPALLGQIGEVAAVLVEGRRVRGPRALGAATASADG